jgi:alkylhydroperoxidase family enzyme
MPTQTARQLEKQPTNAALPAELHALVRLAERVTRQPAEIRPAEVVEAAAAVPTRAEFLDAVGVIIFFNFITRVANALGVDPELPGWLGRFESARLLARNLAALLLRWFVDLRPRQLKVLSPDENLTALKERFGKIEVAALAGSFRHLQDAPHLLEAQRELFGSFLDQIAPAGELGTDLRVFMLTGLATFDEIAVPALRDQAAEWVRRHVSEPRNWVAGEAERFGGGLPPLESAATQFARDVTQRSYSITRQRIDELRAVGLTDERILDLVCGIGLWNAYGRLEILLGALPRASESAGDCLLTRMRE